MRAAVCSTLSPDLTGLALHDNWPEPHAPGPGEVLVAWLRGFGVTTIHTGHGPGALVSGQTLVAKTVGTTAEQAVIVPQAMVAANLGPAALAEGGKAPGTRAKQMAMLRQALISAKAEEKAPAKKGETKPGPEKPPSLDVQTMRDVLARKLPLSTGWEYLKAPALQLLVRTRPDY